MAIGDWYRLIVKFNDTGDLNTVINTLAFRQETGLVLDEAGEDLIGAYRDIIEPQYLPLVSSQLFLRKYTVRGITDPIYIYESADLSEQGSAAGEGQTPQNSCVVTLRTGAAGRSRRGRSYLAPASEGASGGGVFISGYIDAVNAMFADMIPLGGGLEFAEWALGVWSEVLAAGRIVTTVTPQPVVATQRRRRLGVGS